MTILNTGKLKLINRACTNVEVSSEWRVFHNKELCNLYRSPNIGRVVKHKGYNGMHIN
jgi:hypothetical protein